MGATGLNPNVGPPDAGARFIGIQDERRLPPPAAGADWIYKVSGGTWQRIALVAATLTTSAAVANRVPRFRILDGDSNVVYATASATVQAAAAAVLYSLVPGNANLDRTVAGVTSLGLPALWLPAGYQLAVSTSLLDAGDQWSQITLLVEELDRGPLGEQVGTDSASAI